MRSDGHPKRIPKERVVNLPVWTAPGNASVHEGFHSAGIRRLGRRIKQPKRKRRLGTITGRQSRVMMLEWTDFLLPVLMEP